MNEKPNKQLIAFFIIIAVLVVTFGSKLSINHMHPFDSVLKQSLAIIWLILLLRYRMIQRYFSVYFSRTNPTDALLRECDQSSWFHHRAILWISNESPDHSQNTSLVPKNQTDYGRWWSSPGHSVLHINYTQIPAHNASKLLKKGHAPRFTNIFVSVNINELSETTIRENLKSLLLNKSKKQNITLVIDQCHRLQGWSLAQQCIPQYATPSNIVLEQAYTNKADYLNDIDSLMNQCITKTSRSLFKKWNKLTSTTCNTLHDWPFQLIQIKKELLNFLNDVQPNATIRKIEWASRAHEKPSYDTLAAYFNSSQLSDAVLNGEQEVRVNIGINAPRNPINWQPLFWSTSILALISTSGFLLWRSSELKNQWQIIQHTHYQNNLELNAAIVASASHNDLYQSLHQIINPVATSKHPNIILVNSLKKGNLINQTKSRLASLSEKEKITIIETSRMEKPTEETPEEQVQRICSERILSQNILGVAPEECLAKSKLSSTIEQEQPSTNETPPIPTEEVINPALTTLDLTDYLSSTHSIENLYHQFMAIEENVDTFTNENSEQISQLSLSLDPEILEAFFEESSSGEKLTIQRDFLQVLRPVFQTKNTAENAFNILKQSKKTSYALFSSSYDQKWMTQLQQHVIRQLIAYAHQYINERYQSKVLPFYLRHIKNRYPVDPSSTRNINIERFQEFFKKSGIFNQFINETYSAILTKKNEKELYYRSIQGIPISANQEFLKSIMHADILTHLIFDEQQETPSFNLTIQVKNPHEPIELALNHQPAINLSDAMKAYHHFHWPNDFKNSIEWAPKTDHSLSENGPWGLFRIINDLGFKAQDHALMHTKWQGQRIEITSNHTVNPLNLEFYRGFSIPQNT